ncbi:MAG: UDP-N-acetylmuramoyl-L-alanyl-D-glutamate--2,6-diaminopimelate ligase [Myxococcales bacterium]|jgi:UDP-N-acetylmuramoyl-L-alanyl-D-glutamate--2,6-diaminopimelate ligase|nr:UDP-N-acetylmuramoyl-L-alanyl-D-glutamate--2,6-diaminopimelate ligase [Myxococcales bacterium]
MKLQDVIAGTDIHGAQATSLSLNVTGVSCDTRTLQPGELFFAIDSRFAAPAFERGACAVVLQAGVGRPAELPESHGLRSANPRVAMALCAANFFGRPAHRLTMLGVTGTNGKTTTSLLAESMLRAAGESVGVIGTIGYGFAGKTLAAPNTTPGSVPLQRLLADMRAEGVTSVVMEVSSHALDQERAAGIPFTSAAFTNLTRDHLDYHGDMACYFAAKRRLFTELCAGVCSLNLDDPHGQALHAELVREGRVTFGFSTHSEQADLFVTDLVADLDGLRGMLHTPKGSARFDSKLVGRHNVENLLAAVGLVLGAGFELEELIDGIAALSVVPGRLERVPSQHCAVFVDYAHTDDALTHVLAALRPLTTGRLICVFGCGGDRDHGKRPLMGEAVARGADVAIVTNDNPRSESPEAIAAAIEEGLKRGGLSLDRYAVELDRRCAIERALGLAGAQDVVLIAGKGHETYQLIGDRTFEFDDRAEVLAALERLKGEIG